MARHILGLSAFYHDSAAALLVDGNLIAAAQEERFSRKKHDPDFPAESISYVLSQAGIPLTEFEAIVFYDKPFLTFDRLFETYLQYAPRGISSFIKRMPVWLKEKLLMKSVIRKQLAKAVGCTVKELPPLLFTQHHQSHAASAFYPSPFEEAAVLCMDGVGEWATTSAWLGKGNSMKPLWQIDFPDSLGLLYSAFTYFCGFKVNSGEYKLMGLAPYGKPIYQELIEENLIDIKPDGSFKLDASYFDYALGERMTSNKFDELFNGPPRQPETEFTQRECDLAASIQAVTENIVLKLAKTLKIETGCRYLCLAGGVALNCVSNGKLAASGLFEDIWIQPAAGDAGGAVGAAYAAWFDCLQQQRLVSTAGFYETCLGPAFDNQSIKQTLDHNNAVYHELSEQQLVEKTADLLADGNIIGWFQGQMEFGPRALGNRSILADPTNVKMQSRLNLKIKYRESFRPFAPAVIESECENYFDDISKSPYMLLVGNVKDKWLEDTDDSVDGLQKINQVRSKLPAITHLDNSARIQTVSPESNARFHAVIATFAKRSGFPVLVNTSFNIRGEPIVCTPKDAWRCFMVTDMDYLVLGDFLLAKTEQPDVERDTLMPEHRELD